MLRSSPLNGLTTLFEAQDPTFETFAVTKDVGRTGNAQFIGRTDELLAYDRLVFASSSDVDMDKCNGAMEATYRRRWHTKSVGLGKIGQPSRTSREISELSLKPWRAASHWIWCCAHSPSTGPRSWKRDAARRVPDCGEREVTYQDAKRWIDSDK
ncbi:hypothetical protein BDY19DRAFT_151637 [Irpex rosettiformis]|uniref:Uncharacterized protein n=1 Tax=Irpex rosettiformis TaxID=378272 RepID=A0ACB8U385_9APHY|nr:hypothetical protein BDY19DRAFT_151637 [Irpex rosettiformis]